MLETRQLIISDLLDRGDITEADLADAHRYSATRQVTTMQALVEMGAATHRSIALARARVSEHPFVDVARFAINRENASLIPRMLAERAGVFPLFVVDGVLTVAMLDPLDLQALELIRQATHHEIDPVVCEEPVLFELIRAAYASETQDTQTSPETRNAEQTTHTSTEPRIGGESTVPPRDRQPQPGSPGAASPGETSGTVESEPRDVPAAASALHKPVEADAFCAALRNAGYTAIHFESGQAGVACKARKDGKLGPPPPAILGSTDLGALIAEFKGECFREHHRVDPPRTVSVLADTRGETVVIRIGSAFAANSSATPESIGLSESQRAEAANVIASNEGLVLITGVPGSGRTTTLGALLAESVCASRSCVLIETAGSHEAGSIAQSPSNHTRRIRTKPDTLCATIHAATRHDTDIIAIDEITDAASAHAAANAALAGNLVVATFIAASPADAVERLEAFGLTRATIDATLRLVVFQKPTRHESGCPGRAVFETLDPRLGADQHSQAPTRRLSA